MTAATSGQTSGTRDTGAGRVGWPASTSGIAPATSGMVAGASGTGDTRADLPAGTSDAAGGGSYRECPICAALVPAGRGPRARVAGRQVKKECSRAWGTTGQRCPRYTPHAMFPLGRAGDG